MLLNKEARDVLLRTSTVKLENNDTNTHILPMYRHLHRTPFCKTLSLQMIAWLQLHQSHLSPTVSTMTQLQKPKFAPQHLVYTKESIRTEKEYLICKIMGWRKKERNLAMDLIDPLIQSQHYQPNVCLKKIMLFLTNPRRFSSPDRLHYWQPTWAFCMTTLGKKEKNLSLLD